MGLYEFSDGGGTQEGGVTELIAENILLQTEQVLKALSCLAPNSEICGLALCDWALHRP